MAEEDSPAPVHPVIFDTDILVWYLRGNQRARRFIERVPYQQRALSSLTLMELLQGCRNLQEIRQVKTFILENIALVIHPNEIISRRATILLEQHAISHGLRVIDALIAASGLENSYPIATANMKHYRPISALHLIQFKP